MRIMGKVSENNLEDRIMGKNKSIFYQSLLTVCILCTYKLKGSRYAGDLNINFIDLHS